MPGFKIFLNKLLHPPEKNGTEMDWKQYLVYALVALFILFFTFPKFFPEIQTGPDGSEMFAFNYLFYHNIQFGTNLVFTYGPLGFICSPICLGNNFITGMILACIIRYFFIYSFLILGLAVNKAYRVLHIVLIIGMCNLMFIDMALIGGTLFALLIYHARKELAWLIAACAVTTLALFIKSSYGLMSLSILLSYTLYAVIINRRFRVILYVAIFTPLFFFFTWFLLYHNVSGVFNYAWSMYQFSKDNSNAMQVDAVNHWGILAIALICFYLPLLFTRSELTRVLYLITMAALYAAFKYSFAREEDWHQIFLFIFVILVCATFLLINSASRALAVMLPLASIGLLYANMVMTNMYNIDDRKRVTGVGNIITFINDYSTTIKNTKIKDSITLHDKILDLQQVALIANGTVDCYPMELTYIAANTLNWTPRPNLQIGAYTPWLDNHNAAFLASASAPQFYIWELEQPPVNNYSLDNHYLLNDEPITIYNFFNHYKVANFNMKTAIFKHSDQALLGEEHISGSVTGYLGKWLYVPTTDTNTVTRARFHFTNTTIGSLRKTFYKDQLYFIDYMLENGLVKTYRFVPANSVSGLWINPLVLGVTKGIRGTKVQAIRIHVSEDCLLDNIFKMEWTKFHKS